MKIFSPKDSVRVSIKFTKVLYAQLRSQEFDPPAGSGFEIPPTMEGVTQSKEFIEADVGLKVACGFEMLVASGSVKSVGPNSIHVQNKVLTSFTEQGRSNCRGYQRHIK